MSQAKQKMDNVLISTLNRLEDKVDKLSTGLATNTTVTDSHTRMLSDMKGVHDVNAKIILDTHDEMKDIKNGMMRIESWKNGQTLYQQKTLEDVIEIKKRLEPLENDLSERNYHDEETHKNWSSIFWKGTEKIVLIIAGAILISWKEILSKIIK